MLEGKLNLSQQHALEVKKANYIPDGVSKNVG